MSVYVNDVKHKEKAMKHKKVKNTLRQKIFLVSMLIVPITHFLVFWVYVNFNSILMAFQTLTPNGVEFTLKNFSKMFGELISFDATLAIALRNSMLTWAIQNLILFPLSILWAFLIYKRICGWRIYQIIFYIPSIITGSAIAAIYIYMLQDNGPIGQLWQLLNPGEYVPSFLIDKDYAMTSVLSYIVWLGFIGNLVLLTGAMAKIPQEMIESSIIDGCGMWREIFHFTIPLCWPTLSTMIVCSLAGLFTASGPVLLLTGGAGDTYTISYWIYEQVKIKGNYYDPAALGLILTITSLPIVLGARVLMNKIYPEVEF